MTKKLTIIKPNMYTAKSKGALQPLFAAAIAANTGGDFELVLYDDRIEDIPYDNPTDIVAISIETFCAKRSFQIAEEYRKRGVKVIAGGYHPTIMPDECLEHVDTIIIGDLEPVWKTVLKDFTTGKLKKKYQNIDGTKYKIDFNRKIFSGKSYGPLEMAQWGRGCPFSCDFCSIKTFYKSNSFCRPIDDVISEIERLKKKYIFFVDDNLYHNKNHFIDFINRLKGLKIRWMCQISINIVLDDKLLRLMKESGCFMVLIGFETLEPKNLKSMNKAWNTNGMSYAEAVKKIQSHGIMIYGTFIFGYENDSKDSFKYAIDFATESKFFMANFNPLYPLPGTPLYQRFKKQGRLHYEKWWMSDDFYYGKSMFEPFNLSAQELEAECFKAKMMFNSWASIRSRSTEVLKHENALKNLALFLYSNYINRKEIIIKQGKKLGV